MILGATARPPIGAPLDSPPPACRIAGRKGGAPHLPPGALTAGAADAPVVECNRCS